MFNIPATSSSKHIIHPVHSRICPASRLQAMQNAYNTRSTSHEDPKPCTSLHSQLYHVLSSNRLISSHSTSLAKLPAFTFCLWAIRELGLASHVNVQLANDINLLIIHGSKQSRCHITHISSFLIIYISPHSHAYYQHLSHLSFLLKLMHRLHVSQKT